MGVNVPIENRDILQTKTQLKKERFRLFVRRFLNNRLALIGSSIMIFLLLFVSFSLLFMNSSPLEIDPANRLHAPSSEHWFGTDTFGRDLFSRVVHGGFVSLAVGFSATIITAIIGMIIGLYASYYKFLDHILMRICDGLLAFPDVLLAIAITAVLGPRPINVVIAITVVKIPTMARIVRSSALVIKEQTYIEALKAQGASSWRTLWMHIAPNTLSPYIVQITNVFASAIILEAGLSFLGAGVPAPEPSWGNILYDGKVVIFNAWWMTFFPGVFIVLSVLGLNLFGDGLRDLLDPHTNKANK
ncbi:ABC transporter permease [Jeotgalibacillus sp. S-D1]|uniref:ABC transporter permease n=1 Tax=Jeotgalibacillus sp. S-D1 TaxID=2552189 RepID=UPI001059AAAE|nr:ABC transporter permease [Jeotgalibacillus sp. S-D1]TDL30799.1 ABC transporter permease [Jeotgalibacillus sp. S-D1]